MKYYTVNLCFDKTRSQVLLQKKDRTLNRGYWNGVGGKVEQGETAVQCAEREIREETGVKTINNLTWLGTLIIPDDCADRENKRCVLDWFACEIDPDEVAVPPTESEPVQWWGVEPLLGQRTINCLLAGNGDLLYFLTVAVKGYVPMPVEVYSGQSAPVLKAAIRHGDLTVQGKSHAECFKLLPYPRDKELDEQGFVTWAGEFLDRKQAYIVARHYDQVAPNSPSINFKELFSEDLRPYDGRVPTEL